MQSLVISSYFTSILYIVNHIFLLQQFISFLSRNSNIVNIRMQTAAGLFQVIQKVLSNFSSNAENSQLFS